MKPGGRLVSITHGWAAEKEWGSADAFIAGIREGLAAAGFAEIRNSRADAEGGKALLIEARR